MSSPFPISHSLQHSLSFDLSMLRGREKFGSFYLYSEIERY